MCETPSTSQLDDRRSLLSRLGSREWIRLYACPLLVLQNSALFLVMKRSTALHVDRYHITVAVFMQELVKLLLSVSILTILAGSVLEPLWKLWRLRRRMIVLIVPCICYTGQNNLLYVGVQFLPAAVAQVLVQLKLLWAALFSMLLLQKRFSLEGWASFIVLVAGVVLVKNGDARSGFAAGETVAGVGAAVVGAAASIGAAALSGFAGVLLEKTFNEATASLLEMNVCMALISLPLQAMAILEFDRAGIAKDGVFHGFHSDTWGVILIQAVGGLLTAIVIKFCGNILKGFATAMALLSTSLISIPMLGFSPSAVFWVGLFAVCSATMMYSTQPFTTLIAGCTAQKDGFKPSTRLRLRIPKQRSKGRFDKLDIDEDRDEAGQVESI